MIIVMRANANTQEIQHVTGRIAEFGLQAHLSQGAERTIIGVIGDERPLDRAMFEVMEGVERTITILPPYKLASREWQQADSILNVAGTTVGGPQLTLIAGPCSVESRGQLMEIAHAVKEAGATLLRGGAFKPRSSPYTFQGMGVQGLELLAEARAVTGFAVAQIRPALVVLREIGGATILVDRAECAGGLYRHSSSSRDLNGHGVDPELLQRLDQQGPVGLDRSQRAAADAGDGGG